MFLVFFFIFFHLSKSSSSQLPFSPSFTCKNEGSFTYNFTDPQSNTPPEHLNDILISKVKNISDSSSKDLDMSLEKKTHQNCDVLNRPSIPDNLIYYQDHLNITLLKCKKLPYYNDDGYKRCYKLGIEVPMGTPQNCTLLPLPHNQTKYEQNYLFIMLSSELSSLSDSSSRKKFCEGPPGKAKCFCISYINHFFYVYVSALIVCLVLEILKTTMSKHVLLIIVLTATCFALQIKIAIN